MFVCVCFSVKVDNINLSNSCLFQMIRNFRKPLIIQSPKILLRLPVSIYSASFNYVTLFH